MRSNGVSNSSLNSLSQKRENKLSKQLQKTLFELLVTNLLEKHRSSSELNFNNLKNHIQWCFTIFFPTGKFKVQGNMIFSCIAQLRLNDPRKVKETFNIICVLLYINFYQNNHIFGIDGKILIDNYKAFITKCLKIDDSQLSEYLENDSWFEQIQCLKTVDNDYYKVVFKNGLEFYIQLNLSNLSPAIFLLPLETIQHIFSFLPTNNILNLLLTHSYFHRLVKTHYWALRGFSFNDSVAKKECEQWCNSKNKNLKMLGEILKSGKSQPIFYPLLANLLNLKAVADRQPMLLIQYGLIPQVCREFIAYFSGEEYQILLSDKFILDLCTKFPVIRNIESENYDFVDIFLTLKIFINEQDERGMTPLMCAINQLDKVGNDTAENLINCDADLEMRDEHGNDALMLCAQIGNVIITEKLLKRNVDISLTNNQGHNAIVIAAFRNQLAVFAQLFFQIKHFSHLLSYQLFSEIKSQIEQERKEEKSEKSESDRISKLLNASKLEEKEKNIQIFHAFVMVIFLYDIASLKNKVLAFMNTHINLVQMIDLKSDSLLCNATFYKNYKMVLLLISLEKNSWNLQDMKFALYSAIDDNQIDCVKLIFKKYPNLFNLTYQNDLSLLMVAINNKNRPMIQLLLSLKIDLNMQDKENETALMYAVRLELEDIVNYLIILGCDIHKINKKGQTALDIAKEYEFSDEESNIDEESEEVDVKETNSGKDRKIISKIARLLENAIKFEQENASRKQNEKKDKKML